MALGIVGVMLIGNCIPALASVYSASKSGYMGTYSVSGVISVDNVNNTATATARSSGACGMEVVAVIEYNNGKSEESIPSTKYGTDCTASIQKLGVQVNGATGIFTIANNPYKWVESCNVDVR